MRQATGINDCVSEDIRDRLATSAQGLDRWVGFIDCVDVRTIGGDGDRTVGTCYARCNGSDRGCLDTSDNAMHRLVSPESLSVSLLSTLPVALDPGMLLAVPPASMAVFDSLVATGASLAPWMVTVICAVLFNPLASVMV